MVDTDVSDSGVWNLRKRELAAWTLFACAVCTPPLLTHRRLSSAAEIRIQPSAPSMAPAQSYSAGAGVGVGGQWRLDVNTATESEFELLPGIGAGRARAIIHERERRGVFHSTWELTEVPGVTKALIERLEPLLRADPPRR